VNVSKFGAENMLENTAFGASGTCYGLQIMACKSWPANYCLQFMAYQILAEDFAG